MSDTTSEIPILEVLRPIAREICPEVCGCGYFELDAIRDAKKFFEVMRKANIVRYLRDGIDPTVWLGKDEVGPLLKFV